MKLIGKVINRSWFSNERYALVGNDTNSVHAVFSDYELAKTFRDYIERECSFHDAGYEIYDVEGSIEE